MKLIVGLGNPGNTYRFTRHNVGRLFIDFFAGQAGADSPDVKKKLKATLFQLELHGQRVVLAWPDLFMNVSGEAVSKLVEAFSIDPHEDLLVIVDDLALPFGKLRLRCQGSDGGHNGLKSVQAFLNTSQYARLRFGIGHPKDFQEKELRNQPVEDYVLSSFSKEEKKHLESLFKKTEIAVRFWIQGEIAKASSSLTC